MQYIPKLTSNLFARVLVMLVGEHTDVYVLVIRNACARARPQMLVLVNRVLVNRVLVLVAKTLVLALVLATSAR